MYFEIEDLRPDTPRLESSFSRREAVIYSVLVHVLLFAALIYVPQLPWIREAAERARLEALKQQQLIEQRERENARFVFVQPRIDRPAPLPPPRAELSDQDRLAQTLERAPDPTNPLPFARGNSSERVEAEEALRPRGQGPSPEPAPAEEGTGDPAAQTAEAPRMADAGRTAYIRPETGATPRRAPGGALGEALQNLQRYVQQESFENPQGGGGAFGPSIQFDTKGVEFGPWIRRFIAQIKRNWFIPYAAMSFKGHVVLTFNVHKDGRITDLDVVQPSSIDAFNSSAFGALQASNPTQPLPPEYPADKAFFTVTFFYNESPPSQE
jgi:TonB family protein